MVPKEGCQGSLQSGESALGSPELGGQGRDPEPGAPSF